MAIVQPGFIGILNVYNSSVSSTLVRCSSFSVCSNNDPLFYNHVIGLNDTVPGGYETKGEDPGIIQTQRRVFRPSTINISGGISFPATENSLIPFFSYAKYGNYFDIDFNYYCHEGKHFPDCRVNGFDFNIQAKDILNISVDVISKGPVGTTSTLGNYDVPEKMITWDRVKISFANMPFPIDNTIISGLNFKINNNATPIYVSSFTNNLLPSDIRLGMQEVTGSITVYLKAGYEFIPLALAPATITIDLGFWSTNIYVVFSADKLEGLVGPVVTQLPFNGVDKAFG